MKFAAREVSASCGCLLLAAGGAAGRRALRAASPAGLDGPAPVLRVLQEGSGAPAADCPVAGSGLQSLPPPSIADEDGNYVYDIGRSVPHTLCLLVLTDDDGPTSLVPVARSYGGHEWEAHLSLAKQSSSSIVDGVQVDCDVTSEGRCLLALPPPDQGYAYSLFTPQSDHIRSDDDEAARFLEQSTFGPTRNDIQNVLEGGENVFLLHSPLTRKMARWIESQQDAEVTPPTYHREYYRKRANVRFEYTSAWGPVSHPCKEGALYRRFAFTTKHTKKHLDVTTDTATGKRVLSVEGEVLTEVDGPILHGINVEGEWGGAEVQQELTDGTYEICYGPKSGVGRALRFKDAAGTCDLVGFGPLGAIEHVPGNPPIVFVPGVEPHMVLSLPVEDLAAVDSGYFDQFATSGAEAQVVRLTSDLQDEACNSITQTGGGKAPTAIGLTSDNVYYMHDPRFVLRDNTVSSPQPDGGGGLTEATSGGTGVDPLHVATCANVPRTFLNEDTCYMSTSAQSCSTDQQYPEGLIGDYGRGVVVCGSPGEVGNDLSLGGESFRGAFDLNTDFEETASHRLLVDQRMVIWTSVSLNGEDQLRQRTAWALSQILVVNSDLEGNSVTEDWTNYYDMLVRHAFGNYRDLLREVSYSRMMGEFLTYLNSKSTGYEWTRSPYLVEYPDENYAREIMQLFTIGLYELNRDGTRKTDPGSGGFAKTYNSDDVMEYARAWTGFKSQERRGNSAAHLGNRIDPMTVDPRWRDQFPKMGLRGRYIGDGYPLCRDLPKRHFLKKGAKYRLLGYSTANELGFPDNERWADLSNQIRFSVDPDGPLHQALCVPDASGSCTFPPVVELPDNIDCSGPAECRDEMGPVRAVKVTEHVFYEYVQPACVYQAFYPDPQKIKNDRGKSFMCADPNTEVASFGGCIIDGKPGGPTYPNKARMSETFWGEYLNAGVALDRVTRLREADYYKRYYLCNSTGDLRLQAFPPQTQQFLWFSEDVDCFVRAKLNPNGKISVVHSVPDEGRSSPTRTVVDEDSKTFFRVHWSDESMVNDLVNDCDSFGCSVSSDGYCMCDTMVMDEIVFTELPTREEVLTELQVGAFDPDTYNVDYTLSAESTADVKVYVLSSGYSKDTIFEVIDDFGVLQRRKNVLHTTQIVGTDLSFRTPPQFVSPALPTKRDLLYETEATIDHVFYHDNTAPFMALHLAQRFGISNPTPRYVEAIAKAFFEGNYTYDDGSGSAISFGQGKYGDLGAAVAATLLDREARSVLLDDDPTHGQMKEPLLKVMGTMRSLEYSNTNNFPLPFLKHKFDRVIGQMVYAAPDVFSFFSQGFQPNGAVAKAGSVSPESQLHTGPNIVSMMNGLITLIKYGLDRCYDGFGEQTLNWSGGSNCKYRVPGQFSNMSGYLDYAPSETDYSLVVDELATVMTAGRLSSYNRDIIKDAIASETNFNMAAIQAQQLIAASSEFHATGSVGKTGVQRVQNQPPTPSSKPYKAVVFVMLPGGADTWNMIVPNSCSVKNAAGRTVSQQYWTERGDVRLTERLSSMYVDSNSNTGTQQPCHRFVLHPKLTALKGLFDDGDLSFFMNTGVLNQDVTKDDYEALTSTQLFAHNAMQEELQKLDPYDQVARTGVLGRLAEVLNNDYDFKASTLSINHLSQAVFGDEKDTTSPEPYVVSDEDPKEFNSKPDTEAFDPMPHISALNGQNDFSSSIFAETWSDKFTRAIEENDMLYEALSGVSLQSYSGHEGLNMVTKLMATKDQRGSDRDLFFVELGGWDFHSDLVANLDSEFEELNAAIESFTTNVKGMSLWNDVTLMITSDFGRTLTPNSNAGTDHGWAGHYFSVGGALDGGKFFGTYPSDLTEAGELNTGRGRMIPTLSFEAMWAPLIEWMGVSASDIEKVLPNAQNTNSTWLTQEDLFL